MKRKVKIGALALTGAALCALSVYKSIKKAQVHPSSKKKAILVVSFGTSYHDTCRKTIGAIEKALQEAYPDWEVRRAFTSQIVIRTLRERDGIVVDTVEEAMKRLAEDGIQEVVVQSIHVTPGFEYDKMVQEVSVFRQRFAHLSIGAPLLETEKDYRELAHILSKETAGYEGEDTAIVWMGHGTRHEANAAYARMQQTLIECGCKQHFVGTVEAKPALDDVMACVKACGAKKVVLLPLMIVAGDHANNDMAGSDEKSWKSQFEQEGFEVIPVLKGMGEYRGIKDMFIRHVGEAAVFNEA